MRFSFVLAALLVCTFPVQAEIYKAIDEDGHVTYTSEPIKGGRRLDLPPLPTTAPPAKSATPKDFPKVDESKQKERDALRREILEDELAAEEKLLEEARKNLNEASPEVYKGQDGKTYRNVAKFLEKTKQISDQIELHESNITALKTELSKFK